MTWVHYALLSALFAGLTAVLAKAGARDIDADLATAIRTTFVLLLACSIVLAAGTPVRPALGTRTLALLALSGLATGASWLCYFRALKLGEASSVAPVDKLGVVFAMALAALFLGEELTWRHYAGGSLVVAGAVVIAWR